MPALTNLVDPITTVAFRARLAIGCQPRTAWHINDFGQPSVRVGPTDRQRTDAYADLLGDLLQRIRRDRHQHAVRARPRPRPLHLDRSLRWRADKSELRHRVTVPINAGRLSTTGTA